MADVNTIPRPKRKPDVPEYYPLVDQKMIDFATKHEAPVAYLYKDTKDIITTGIGFNVDSDPKKAHNLGMYWAEGDKAGTCRASLGEVKRAYDRVRKLPAGKYYTFYNPIENPEKNLSKILMREEDMVFQVRKKLEQSEQELKRKIPNFNTIPYPARKAFLDMQYNMGDAKFRGILKGGKKGWPKLFAAIGRRDWKEAAQESRRGDVGDDRNNATREWLLEAAAIEERRKNNSD